MTRVPAEDQTWSVVSLFGVSLAIPTALVFFAVGGALELRYGTANLAVGLLVSTMVIGAIGAVICIYASHSGLDSDLMSIATGFGFRGSAVTSLIYAGNFFVLFSLEQAIIADAFESHFGLSRHLVAALIGGLLIALTWYGVRALNLLMWVTLPLFVTGIAAAVSRVIDGGVREGFGRFGGEGNGLSVVGVMSVFAAMQAFVVNASVGADLGRFLNRRRRVSGSVVIGVVLQFLCFQGSAMAGAWFAFQLGNPDPGVYFVALLGGTGVVLVFITQVRINAINVYSGSLALSNFGARALNLAPGRHIWSIVLVVGASALTLRDLYTHVASVLTFEAIFVTGWVMTLVSYILSFGLLWGASDSQMGIDSAPDFDSLGLISLAASLTCSLPLAFGILGGGGKISAPIVAGVVPLIVVPILRRASLSRAGESED